MMTEKNIAHKNEPSLKISGLIITFNEAENIRECIRSLREVCDDCVVVDSNSADKTQEIAKAEGATVIVQPFLGDGPQRILGLPYCKHEWVFNLDADERLEEDCIRKIQSLQLGLDGTDVYELRRHNFIGEQITPYAGQYPDYVARLFNKTTAHFSPVKAHTRVKGRRHCYLDCHIRHFSYKDYSDLFLRQCKYATWGAEEIVKNGRKPSFLTPFIHGSWSFIRHYFLKRGFLAGNLGLTISIAKAAGAYLKYAHACELAQRRRENRVLRD